MQPQGAATKPNSAARGEIGRLGFFGETENARIEGPRLGLLPRRHGELHVIQSDYVGQVALPAYALRASDAGDSRSARPDGTHRIRERFPPLKPEMATFYPPPGARGGSQARNRNRSI